MKLLFISCCCLLFSRSLNTNLNTIKYFLESAESKNMKEFINFALLMTRLCLFMICQVIILRSLVQPGTRSVRVSSLVLPGRALRLSLQASARTGPVPHISHLLTHSIVGPPALSSAGLSIDQTKQEWQFRMLISVTSAAANVWASYSDSGSPLVITRGLQTWRENIAAVLASLPVCFCLCAQTWPVEREVHCPILTLQVILHSVNIVHLRVCSYLWGHRVTSHLSIG